MSNLLDTNLSNRNLLNTNLLNTYIVNQYQNKTYASDTFDTTDKIKPMKEKGRLLPSRIIGSPVEYAKDLKKDFVSIGKAAKGQGNDHELGRINDLAMKLGSLGLAAYLCVKNPLKLNKAMEFIGFGTFFASMALWPKLAIQAPLKARTGVDVHQKYIDSQGRKKMLFQDPQYDLTDLYSREDLDKIGRKMGVAEDLPDRDSFIKQRAKKTAVQANTLWMLTAGIASPTMSALACNRLEKPVEKAIEKSTLKRTQDALDTKNYQGRLVKIKNALSKKSFERFIKKNADKPLDDKMISKISSILGKKVNSSTLEAVIPEELSSMAKAAVDDSINNLGFIKNALKGIVPESVFASLSKEQEKALNDAINNKSFKQVANILAKSEQIPAEKQKKLAGEIFKTLNSKKAAAEKIPPDVSRFTAEIKALYANVTDFSSSKNALDKYVSARVGDQSGTYIANQWSRVCNKFIKSLKLSSKELKAVSEGNVDIIYDKLSNLASNEKKYNRIVEKLVKLINDFELKTGTEFINTVQCSASDICSKGSTEFRINGFMAMGDKIKSDGTKATVENFINKNAADRALGAQSSFYRLLQSLDVFKRINDNSIRAKIEEASKQVEDDMFKRTIEKLFKEEVKDENLKNQIAKILERTKGKSLKEQTIAVLNEISDENLKTKIREVLKSAKKSNLEEKEIDKLVKACRNVIMDATTSDYSEKLKSSKYNLSLKEYRTVMRVLFDDSAVSTIEESLTKSSNELKAMNQTQGFRAYKGQFRHKIANWENDITPELSRRVVDEPLQKYLNANERNNIAGKSINNLIKDTAKQTYNTQKWLKIFGGVMLALTLVTLGTGLTLGRKGKTEKQAEKESKIND